MIKIISHSVNETIGVGKSLALHLAPGSVVCLSGALGSGKTVVTKGIAQGLGVSGDVIISPTFVLMRQYEARLPLYHLDLYRLGSLCQIAELGFEEFIFADGVAVIEWAERLNAMAPEEFLKIALFVTSKERRRLEISAVGERYRGVLKDIYENHKH